MDEQAAQALRDQVSDLILGQAGSKDDALARLEGQTADSYRDVIRTASIVSSESTAALGRWVEAGRHAGLSWAAIGETLGISRQAAQQRFGTSARPLLAQGEFDPDDETLIVRTGLTAFNEVPVLDEEGRNGRAVVGAAILKLYFEDRGTPHRNLRVISPRSVAVVDQYTAEGWDHTVTWFPFHYFTKPVDKIDG